MSEQRTNVKISDLIVDHQRAQAVLGEMRTKKEIADREYTAAVRAVDELQWSFEEELSKLRNGAPPESHWGKGLGERRLRPTAGHDAR